MTTYTIEVPDDYTPPSYTALFDFIDSEESAEFLARATRGELSFKSCFDALHARAVLPPGISPHLYRVWNVVIDMFLKRAPTPLHRAPHPLDPPGCTCGGGFDPDCPAEDHRNTTAARNYRKQRLQDFLAQ